MKILNLYACLGGNRYKWDDVTDVDITAVELDPYAAELYAERFPNDSVIVADAHQYLIDHYKEFDFIWSSPPCPTHSRSRFWGFGRNGKSPVYPDLTLYEEILFLHHHFDGKFVVENVIPYYEPLIPAHKADRHLYWANFKLPSTLSTRSAGVCQGSQELQRLSAFHDFDFTLYNGNQRRDKMARNLVDYEAGQTILEIACGILKKSNVNQLQLL